MALLAQLFASVRCSLTGSKVISFKNCLYNHNTLICLKPLWRAERIM